MDFNAKLTGFEKTYARLKGLELIAGGEAVSDAAFEVAGEMRDQVKANAPVGESGKLRESIVAVREVGQIEGMYRSRGTIRKYAKKFGGKDVLALMLVDNVKAPHAHLVERGHAIVRKGRIFGHVPAHPFFRPVVARYSRGRYLRAIEAAIHRQLNQAGG